jgi:hypothetical protein
MRIATLLLMVAACSHQPPDPFAAGESLYCQREIRCGGIAASALDECLKSQRRMDSDERKALAAGRIRVDDAGVSACFASMDPNACDSVAPADVCFHAVTPLVPLGGKCDANFECIGGVCGCEQVCVASISACAAPCADGEVCRQGACVTRGGEGAACNDEWFNFDCSEGLLCRGQICIAPPAIGQPCAVDRQGGQISFIVGPSCAGDAYCDVDSYTCVARLALGAACSAPGICVAGADCIGGTCRGFLDDGQACDPDAAANGTLTGCPLDSVCDDGTHTCRLVFAGEGDACDQDHWCDGDYYCKAGRCAVRSSSGESCTPSSSDAGTDNGQDEPCVSPSTCDPKSHTCVAMCSS